MPNVGLVFVSTQIDAPYNKLSQYIHRVANAFICVIIRVPVCNL